MYRLVLFAIVAVGVLVAVIATFFGAVERGRVTRARLAAFARRHGLVVTADNGNQVIRYLATTRRWRTIGLTAGLFLSIGWALTAGSVRVDFLTLFAGWFVGALIAEVRLARTSFGPRRVASLVRRVPVRYLPRPVWMLLPAAATVSTGIAVATAIMARRGRPIDAAAGLLWLAAMVVAVIVYLVQLRVLHRPQPVAAPDLVAAEDAIRSRSLHVLAGGGTTLVLYCALGQLALLAPPGHGTASQAIEVVSFAGVFAVPLFGWTVALANWRVPREAGPPPSAPSAPSTSSVGSP